MLLGAYDTVGLIVAHDAIAPLVFGPIHRAVGPGEDVFLGITVLEVGDADADR
jgi:hypothetical protein